MMYSIIILLTILVCIAFIQFKFTFLPKQPPLKTVFDVKQLYLEEINTFIQRETLFEFLKWINDESNVVSIGNNKIKTDFANQIKDNRIVKDKTSNITILIISRMSKDMKTAFYRVYDSKNDTLELYVSRWVLFFIRKVVVEITQRLQLDTKSEYSKIVKEFAFDLEKYLYKISKIEFDINAMIKQQSIPLPPVTPPQK